MFNCLKNTLLLVLLLCTSQAKRTVQFIYFNQPSDTSKSSFMYASGKEPVEVEFPKYNFSTHYELEAGEQTLEFLPQLLPDRKEIPVGTPNVTIPSSWKKALILVFNDSKNSVMPIKLKAIDASPSNFDLGQIMFINFSRNTIYGAVGDQKIMVHPLKKTVAKNISYTDRQFIVNLKQRSADEKQDYRFLEKVFVYYEKQRSLIFIYTPEGDKNISYFVTTIRDPEPAD